jgi:hypothetical protein
MHAHKIYRCLERVVFSVAVISPSHIWARTLSSDGLAKFVSITTEIVWTRLSYSFGQNQAGDHLLTNRHRAEMPPNT